MFSSRVPPDLTPNALARSVAVHRAAGRRLLDLTVTNPTSVGLDYPPDILAPLANASSIYRPEPFGSMDAREAVARDYERRGTGVAPERLVLTASTSEAYSVLFKLLCDPGDAVLVPSPSYPLFDHLCSLDGVTTASYAIDYLQPSAHKTRAGGTAYERWMIDEHSVDSGWTDKTRAVLAVSPNNPTGSLLSPDEEEMLSARCAARDAALIIDEVFIDYLLGTDGPMDPRTHGPMDPRTHGPMDPRTHGPMDPRTHGPRDPRTHTALTFRLGGLSKSAGLPQVKLGWFAVDGPPALVADALLRLEIICDAYLSVSTPVQTAAADLISRGADIRAAILERVQRNHRALARAAADTAGAELLHSDGGWSAVLRVPSTYDEEQLVLELLEQDGVLVHPGFFFDFPHEGFLVVSLLPPYPDFDEGISRVMQRLHD